ncbi:MAG: peptidase M10 [Chitinophagaceae bacterium]|nr:MAG: peptidase M10 [Chitinophagaceae bacterium]
MGIVEKDEQAQQLYLRANIILYGDAASEALSAQLAADIASHWNEPQATVLLRSIPYRLQFRIAGTFAPNLQPADVYENDDPTNNYFRIESFSRLEISFVDGLGCNTGYFKLDNLLNNSTTAAHEFGHTLGLDHPHNLDIRGKGQPGIMYPRGTITDLPYQYDPAAAPGQKGGTMNPFHRRVLQADIDDLNIPALFKWNTHAAVIGAFSSIWHDKHIAP